MKIRHAFDTLSHEFQIKILGVINAMITFCMQNQGKVSLMRYEGLTPKAALNILFYFLLFKVTFLANDAYRIHFSCFIETPTHAHIYTYTIVIINLFSKSFLRNRRS